MDVHMVGWLVRPAFVRMYIAPEGRMVGRLQSWCGSTTVGWSHHIMKTTRTCHPRRARHDGAFSRVVPLGQPHHVAVLEHLRLGLYYWEKRGLLGALVAKIYF